MLEGLRKDKFYHNKLKSLVGPLTILKKNEDFNSVLPKIFVSRSEIEKDVDFFHIISEEIFQWVNHGDVVFADGRGYIRVVLSSTANSNTLLLTERCDNLCLFCSQPPREVNDEILYNYAIQSIVSFESDKPIGLSGGEPFLSKELAINFLRLLEKFGDRKSLHFLTNGRAFSDKEFAKEIAKFNIDSKILLGIPLYSDISSTHDLLVNSDGAWDETISGIINAGSLGIDIELRIIPTQKNYKDIVPTIELAMKCFNSICKISIMNLEQTGWAIRNWDDLYIEPTDYIDELIEACDLSIRFGVDVSLFNYPLCHLPEQVHHHARKSISDWKNSYTPDCKSCSVKHDCGGFFTSIKNKKVYPLGRIL